MKYQLHNADFRDILPTMPNDSVEMVLTDIPYGEVNRKGKIRNLDKGKADICDFDIRDMAHELVRVCSGSIYVFCGIEQVSDLRAQFVDDGMLTRLCIWEKSNPSPMNGQHFWLSSVECCVFARKKNAVFNEFCKSAVWRFPSCVSEIHPTQKPLSLFRYLIKTSSSPMGGVLDICMGSGTTGVAAIQAERDFIGVERDADFFKSAKERIEKEYAKPRQQEFEICE